MAKRQSVTESADPQLPPWSSVLAVVAHPDDESFGLGALLDGFVQLGSTVSVLCLTQGEASTLGMAADLSHVRALELRQAAAELGVVSAVLLDHPDGLLAEMDPETLTGEVLRELETRPVDGIVVFDPSGITGHPDHIAATTAGLEAAEQASLPVVAWTLPVEVAEVLNTEFDAGFVGHTADEVDVVVTIDRERQRLACLRHASQAIPTSVLWRRLELLGDVEAIRWLRR